MTTHERRSDDRADGLDSRNRDIATIDRIFRPTGGPAGFIDEVLERRGSADVVEVGFGWGVALLDLVWRYRDRPVRFHGVDIEPKVELIDDDGVLAWAHECGAFPPDATARDVAMPTFAYYDATTLRLPDESVDVLYSAVTIRFIADKVAFIEDAVRVLRPGGVALLHIGESNWEYPHAAAEPEPLLTTATSRLVVRSGPNLVPLQAVLRSCGDDVEFTVPHGDRLVLVARKVRSAGFRLGLELDADLTMNGRNVPLLNRRGEVRGGVRSVYSLPAERYRKLIDAGVLEPMA